MLIRGHYLGMPPSILEVMLKKKISCSDEILLPVLKSPEPEKKLIQEAQTICKLPAVNPATSAAGERSFSSAQRLKMWLPSRMWPSSVEWSHAENRKYLATLVCEQALCLGKGWENREEREGKFPFPLLVTVSHTLSPNREPVHGPLLHRSIFPVLRTARETSAQWELLKVATLGGFIWHWLYWIV